MKELIFDCYGEQFNLTEAIRNEKGCMVNDNIDTLVACYKGQNLLAIVKGERLTDAEHAMMKDMAEQEIKERCFNAIHHYIRMKRGYTTSTVNALYAEYLPQLMAAI